MAKAIFVAGFPGSGKTFYVNELAKSIGAILFDDFKGRAINNCSSFPFARHFVDLINCLRSGKNCIISDIDFCYTEARQEAETFISELVPEASREWVFFEKNPDQCKINIEVRARNNSRDKESENEKLARYFPKYEIPEGATVIPVYDGNKEKYGSPVNSFGE